jgi:hypothetical protein
MEILLPPPSKDGESLKMDNIDNFLTKTGYPVTGQKPVRQARTPVKLDKNVM